MEEFYSEYEEEELPGQKYWSWMLKRHNRVSSLTTRPSEDLKRIRPTRAHWCISWGEMEFLRIEVEDEEGEGDG